MTSAPNPTGTVTVYAPVPDAVVAANEVVPPESVAVALTTTRAPGAVVPVTAAVPPDTAAPDTGLVIVVGTVAGGACLT